MKLTIERDVLAEAVTWTARALPAKPPMPVLAGLRLSAAADGTVTFAAFDYDVSARTTVTAEAHTPGEVLVYGKLLADICRSLPGKPVTVSLEGTKVRLTCGASKFTLLTMPVEEYPSLPASPGTSGTVDPSVLAAAVSQVAFAASKDDNLPILTAVRVEAAGTELTLIATDRYRLAVRTLPWTPADPDAAPLPALVRARTLAEVAKTFGGSAAITVALGADLAAFEAGARRSTTLLIDGDYPKVKSLFPPEHTGHAVIEVDPIVEAVRRVALVAERHTPVRLGFTDGSVLLEAGQGEDAQAAESVEASLIGEEITQAYNPGYLLDGLGALSTQYARLSFTTPGKPVVITGQTEAEGENDPAYRYLLMPVRA